MPMPAVPTEPLSFPKKRQISMYVCMCTYFASNLRGALAFLWVAHVPLLLRNTHLQRFGQHLHHLRSAGFSVAAVAASTTGGQSSQLLFDKPFNVLKRVQSILRHTPANQLSMSSGMSHFVLNCNENGFDCLAFHRATRRTNISFQNFQYRTEIKH